MDIVSFLASYPPFDALERERLEEIARGVQIEFFPAGTLVLQQSAAPAEFLYVVRTGAIELIDEDRVIDLLVEGEPFGHPSLLSGLGPTFTARAHEDTLCYLIDHRVAEDVLKTDRGLAFLSSSLRRRVVRAVDSYVSPGADPWLATVRSAIRRPAVTSPPDATVREAAEAMARERVSSLLVLRAEGWAILTDRDLRSRVLARGRSPDTVVGEVVSYPAITIPAEALLTEVLPLMLEKGVHHLPVVEDDGALVGVVTDTDLMGLERKTPFALKSAIERAAGEEEVVAAGHQLPGAVCSLVDANVEPIDIGHVVAVSIDAMTRRFIELAIARLGDPPAPWAWLSLGSEARQEQALLTDQDHALAFDPRETPREAVDPYFEKLAGRVTDGLEAAGIPRCGAGVHAANAPWRRPVAEWVSQFTSWMKDPSREGGQFTSIAFDFRRVAGPLVVEQRLDDLIRNAPENRQFVRHIAHAAIDARPPTGFVRDLVVESRGEHAGKLDVKHGGITPITNLARAYSVAAGITEIRTLRRLRESASAGAIDEETRAGLEEAFRLLWQIRLEHQCLLVRSGRQADDYVDPKSLGPLTRQGIKEAFRVIDRAQRSIATEFGLRLR